MQKQIVRIAPFQSAKVLAVMYFIVALPLILMFALGAKFTPGATPISLFQGILFPFIYAIVGFVITIIGAWIYNLVAKVVGGIEYTSIETRDF
jgi:hypothetical protein